MGLFKTSEEKAAAQARRVERRFAKSPEGKATAAYERGDVLFQVALPVGDHSASTLSEIEAIGWHLDHVGYTSNVSSTSTTNTQGSLDYVSIDSQITGVYLFRRP